MPTEPVYQLRKLRLENGAAPFDRWFAGLSDIRVQRAVDQRQHRRVTLKKRKQPGKNFSMKIEDAEIDLLLRLRNPDCAAAYLEAILSGENENTFLISLRNVIEAFGGMSALSKKADISRQSLYKIVSKNGNPTIGTLSKILEPLGLRVSVRAA